MTTVESARREWEAGHRRFLRETSDPSRADDLHRQVDAIIAELRRRVGATFTLDELAGAYAQADRWLLDVVSERAPSKGGVRTATVAGDAAFHDYSRRALDYEP
jgi:hypothetical protein